MIREQLDYPRSRPQYCKTSRPIHEMFAFRESLTVKYSSHHVNVLYSFHLFHFRSVARRRTLHSLTSQPIIRSRMTGSVSSYDSSNEHATSLIVLSSFCLHTSHPLRNCCHALASHQRLAHMANPRARRRRKRSDHRQRGLHAHLRYRGRSSTPCSNERQATLWLG